MLFALPPQLPSPTDAVVYEANLRAEGPQVGFKALTRRLGSIQALGVNVLWLMPVQPVGKLKSAGGLGSPYATADFDTVNPEFGSVEDFRSLVKEAHRRHMAVILDWVVNHSAWDNPWLKSHPDWYSHDAAGNVISPPNTNWHDVAQFDFRNTAMRKGMIASMRGWVNRFEIDGFRCDSAEFPPLDFWREAIPQLRKESRRPLIMIAEGYRPDLAKAGFDLLYGWHFCDRILAICRGRKASDLKAEVIEEARNLPPGSGRLRFITNHDRTAWDGTLMDQYKEPGAIKIAFAASAFYGGSPMVYSGQEVNWPGRIPLFEHTTIDWSRNPDSREWIASVLRLRQSQPVLRQGAVEDLSTDDVLVLHRTFGDQEALVLANVRGREISAPLPAALAGRWRDGLSRQRAVEIHDYRLGPYVLRVYLRQRATGTRFTPIRSKATAL